MISKLEIFEPPLGEGGFGMVFRARLGSQIVALKVLSLEIQKDSDASIRFEREARILGSIRHAHIIRYLGMVDSPRGRALAMELAESTLADYFEEHAPLAWKDALPTFISLFDALATLHEQQVIHRDLKPQNVLRVNGVFKLADLGIARVPHEWDEYSLLTATGFQPGTPRYQSPEQVRGYAGLDRRSDLYAMGVMMFEALTAQYYLDTRRFRGPLDLSLAILQDPPRRWPKHIEVPEALRGLLERLLAKDPERRPSSAEEVQHTLEAILNPELSFPAVVRAITEVQSQTLESFLHDLKRDFPLQVHHHQIMEGTSGLYAPLENPLPIPLEEGLKALGISQLYAHQAAGMDALRQGHHTLLVTGTASGKTLTYTLPLLEKLLDQPQTRALMVFPVKALAQDQRYALERLTRACGMAVDAERFDGDTSAEDRRRLEAFPPHILFVNPDILHGNLLKNHARMAPFWRELRYVVLDEAHLYNGEFGSHVAQVLKRLRSVAAQYGAQPQFVAASATLEDASAHLEHLVGVPFKTVTQDAAPRSKRHFVFWKPFGAALPNSEQWMEDTVSLTVRCWEADRRVIAFPGGRQLAEDLALKVRGQLEHAGLDPQWVSVYRGGLLPRERVALEERIRAGEIRAVMSTSALEVGVDIGGLDAVLLPGYPEEAASFWQRAGRAGRRGQDALIVLIPRPNRFDLYHLEHPELYLNRPAEGSRLYPDRFPVRELHLAAAEKEKSLLGPRSVPPFSSADLLRMPQTPTPKSLFPQPHRKSIRGTDTRVRILEVREGTSGQAALPEREIGMASGTQALYELHPEALYRHLGRTYRVGQLTPQEARVKAEYTRHTTRADLETFVNIRSLEGTMHLGEGKLCSGALNVRTVLLGYREYDGLDRKIKTSGLAPRSTHLDTQGVWLELPEALRAELDGDYREEPGGVPPSYQAIHATEHLLSFALSLETGCSPREIRGLPFAAGSHPEVKGVSLFLWDGSELGLGLAQTLLHRTEAVVARALEVVSVCKCRGFEGCPRCTLDPHCSLFNEHLWKAGGRRVLEWLALELKVLAQS